MVARLNSAFLCLPSAGAKVRESRRCCGLSGRGKPVDCISSSNAEKRKALGLIILVFILVALACLNALATKAVLGDELSERRQKIVQLCLVWFLPLLGALLVLAVHRKPEPASGHYRNRAGTEFDSVDGVPGVRRMVDLFDED